MPLIQSDAILLPCNATDRKNKMQPIELKVEPLELVAKALKKAGSFRALEKATGLSRSTWTRLRKGDTDQMRKKTAQRLIDYLHG